MLLLHTIAVYLQPHAPNGNSQNTPALNFQGHINPIHTQQPPQQRLPNGLMPGGGGGGGEGEVVIHGGGHQVMAEVTV